MIEVENLSFRYLNRMDQALQDLSFIINRGEAVLLLGPIGSGKTTLLLAILGLIPRMIPGEFSGAIRIEREDISKLTLSHMGSKVGLVLQDPEAQIVTLRVDDEVAFGMENLSVDEAMLQHLVNRSLDSLGLKERSTEATDQLSYGEKQKVVIASILAMNPEILLFDEPTSNLDQRTTRDFFQLLKSLKLRQKKTIMMVEHRLDPIIELFDRVIILGKKGQIEIIATPQELLNEKYLQILDNIGIWLPTSWMPKHVRDSSFGRSLNDQQSIFPLSSAGLGIKGVNDPESSRNPLIELTKLSYSYAGGHAVLSELTATIRERSIHFILGPNGSGKSTLAKLLSRLLKPPAGSIFYRGRDILSISPKKLYSKVGYVFQNPEQQFLTARVYDEVAYGFRHQSFSNDEIALRTWEILRFAGLEGLAEVSPFRLSGGQKRLLSVATMMLGQEFLIFDEPTYGLDRFATHAVFDQTRRLQESGRTILIITHETDLVWRYAEDVMVIERGRLLFKGTKEELLHDKEIVEKAGLEAPPKPTIAGEGN